VAYWLLKTEPGTYGWDDLVRDKKATWDGITNSTALIHLRSMKKNDLALIYHTGDERQVVAVAEVLSNPYPDPKQDNKKLVVIDLKPKRKLKRPVTLDEFKADPAFKAWDLLRIGRLSVVPVPDKMWKRIEELSERSQPV
jgi:predicted RNA-binding protein with PUA-like domain